MCEEENCSICIEPFNGLVHKLECNHSFHYECLTQLKTEICPLCRTIFSMFKVHKTKYEYYNKINDILSLLYFDLADENKNYEFNDKMDKHSVRYYVKEQLDILSNMIEFLNIKDKGKYSFELDLVHIKNSNRGININEMFDFIKDIFDEFINDDNDYISLTIIETIMYDRGLLLLNKYIKMYDYKH